MDCPTCGAEGAYQGFNTVECRNSDCRHYKMNWREALREVVREGTRVRVATFLRDTPYKLIVVEPYIPMPSPEDVQTINNTLDKERAK